jgi:hypothetical protein
LAVVRTEVEIKENAKGGVVVKEVSLSLTLCQFSAAPVVSVLCSTLSHFAPQSTTMRNGLEAMQIKGAGKEGAS